MFGLKGVEKTTKATETKLRAPEPFHEFLDSLEEMRVEIKERVKDNLRVVFEKRAKSIEALIAYDIKESGFAQDKILKIILPFVKRLTVKYFDDAADTGLELATHVIKEIRGQRIKKSPSNEIEWDFMEKEIEYGANQRLTAQLNAATMNYVVSTKSLLSNLLLGGMRDNAHTVVEGEIRGCGGSTGRYLNAVAGSAQAYPFNVADQAMAQAFEHEFQKPIRETRWQWVTFFTRSCPDCRDRHAQVENYDRWQWRGLPRTGHTVCRAHCHCVLIPEEYPVEIKESVKLENALTEARRVELKTKREARRERKLIREGLAPRRIPGSSLWYEGENRAADAVVVAETNDGQAHVLLIQRQDGSWALPGGFVDGNKPGQEAAAEASLRELNEETGLKTKAKQDSIGYYNTKDRDPRSGPGGRWVSSRAFGYDLGSMRDLPPVTPKGDPDKGAKKAQWVVINKLPKNFFADHRQILEKYLDARQHQKRTKEK